MITNYNGVHFTKLQQYNALIALLENSKKTRNFPIFSIENVLNNEWLLLFLLNQKRYIESSRQKNIHWNIMYGLTKRWNNFVESIYFSKNGFFYSIKMLFVIFVLPLLFITGIDKVEEKLPFINNTWSNSSFAIFILIIWMIYIFHLMRKNRKRKIKKFIPFKKKYNLN